MTSYTSAKSGNWNAADTWSPAGIPGSGDTVLIQGDHRVVMPWQAPCRARNITCDGGRLEVQLNSHMLDDAADAFVLIKAISGSGLLTPYVGRLMSASPNPANPWRLIIETAEADDTRNDLSKLQCTGNAPTLAYGASYVSFGTSSPFGSGYGTPKITSISPRMRTPVIEYHRIAGRNAGGRSFLRGNDSGRMTASGFAPDSTSARSWFESLKDLGKHVSLTGWHSHMARGIVEDVRLRHSPGSSYVYFDIHLVEDL